MNGAAMKTSLCAAALALLLVLCAAVGCPAVANAGEASDQIKGTIDRGIEILMRPELQGDAKKSERRALLRKELYPRFDFEEISRRALGVNWKNRTPEEKQEFIEVFKTLLENSYASKVEGYKGERIVYGKEALDLPYAEVRTKIVSGKGEQFDVNYRALKNGDEWRIYDIVIEGVSLVNNYRSQFTDMLSRYSFEEMMERLRKTAKAAEEKGG